MVRDDEAVNDQALALVKKLGATRADNATSAALAKQAAATMADFDKLHGAAYPSDPKLALGIGNGMTSYLRGLPEELFALFGTGHLGYTAARTWGKMKGVVR